MSDVRKTKTELIEELEVLRRRVTELEESAARCERAVEAIQGSERRYRLLAENVTDVIWTMDMNLRLTYVSPSVTRLRGYSVEEAMAQRLDEILTPASLQVARKALAEELAIERMEHEDPRRFRTLELEQRCKDGSTVWTEVKMGCLRGEGGEHVGILGVARDITLRRQIESEVLKTKEFYERLVGNAGDTILSTTPAGLVTSWNSGAERLYGYTKGEVLGRDVRDLIVPLEKRDEVTMLIEGVSSGPPAVKLETVRRRKDGSLVEVQVSVSPIQDSDGRMIGVSGIHKDISERKRWEREIVEAKEYFEDLVGSAGDAVVSVRVDGTIVTWNTGAEELFGYSKEEALANNIRIIARDDILADMESVMASARSGKVVRNHEAVRYRKDGTPVEISLTTSPIRDAEGRVLGLCAIYKDMSERKRVEREVAETKDFLDRLIATAGDAIIYADADNKVRVWNDAAERLYGYTRAEALGQSIFSLHVPKEKRDEVREITRTGPRDFETKRDRKDGSLVWVSITNAPLRDKWGNHIGVISVQKDITERKQAEQELAAYKEQLRALTSQLALAEEQERRRIAGDLHDHIGNELAVSRIKLRTLRDMIDSSDVGPSIDEILGLLDQTIQHSRLLTFELSPPALYQFGLDAAVEGLVRRHQESYGIVCEFVNDGSPRLLEENARIHLFRAIRELLANVAKHAHASRVRVSLGTEEDKLVVAVEDNGVGFDSSQVRSAGRGTDGFGLFNIGERLNQLGGYMRIESRPGKGTRVTLVSPLRPE